MEIATIKVNTVTACVECKKPIPRGLVGGTVSIHYADPIWNDLNKTVVFQGAVTRDVLNVTDTVEIPWETVAKAGKTLHIGFYGSNADGSIVVPTIWAELGMIQGAADPSGDLSAEPTRDVWEQMQAMIGNLDKLATQSKASIVDAVNEAFTQGETGPSAVKSVNGIFPDGNGNVEVDAQSKMLIVTATRNLDDTITASHSSEEVAAFVKSGGVPVVNFAGSWYWYEGNYASSWQYFVRYLNTYQGLLLQERFRLFPDKTATITFSNDGVFHNFLEEFVEEKGFVKTVNGKAPDENGNVFAGDGYSPTVTLTDINGGVRVAVTDVNGTVSTDITATKIGAAPAGYGLGGSAIAIDSWDNAWRNGYYRSSVSAPDGDGHDWYGFVSNCQDGLVTQVVFRQGSAADGVLMATRGKYAGTWKPWEWVNPPMVPGVEYRTTERWNSKSVYTKLIHFGTFNAPAGAEFSIGTIGTDYIPFRWQGYATKTDGINLQIPSKLINADMYLYEYGGATYIYMSIQPQNFESTGLIGYLRIWYTKD